MKSGDPRLSVEERYASKQAYLDRVQATAHDLVQARYLLERGVGGMGFCDAVRRARFSR